MKLSGRLYRVIISIIVAIMMLMSNIIVVAEEISGVSNTYEPGYKEDRLRDNESIDDEVRDNTVDDNTGEMESSEGMKEPVASLESADVTGNVKLENSEQSSDKENISESVLDTEESKVTEQQSIDTITDTDVPMLREGTFVPVESIQLSDTEKILEKGEVIQLTVNILPEDATDKSLVWESSDDTVATVGNGLVTAIKSGVATITARTTDETISATCNIIVTEPEQTGEITWDITDGVLTITGTGPMGDYASTSDVPWYSRRNEITQVVIGNGISSIGARSFFNFSNVTEFNIGNSIKTIGERAFQSCTGVTDIVFPETLREIGNYAFYNCTCSLTFRGDAPTLGTTSIPAGTTINYREDKAGYDTEIYTQFTLVSQHVGEWVIEKEPTCTEEGQRTLYCTYHKETYTETIPALGHSYENGTCTVCGEIQILSQGSCGSNISYITLMYSTTSGHQR